MSGIFNPHPHLLFLPFNNFMVKTCTNTLQIPAENQKNTEIPCKKQKIPVFNSKTHKTAILACLFSIKKRYLFQFLAKKQKIAAKSEKKANF